MHINVDAIPDGGSRVRFGMGEAWATRAARAALDADPSVLEGELLFAMRSGGVSVTGNLRATAPQTCERCDARFELALDTEADLTYVSAARQVDAGELELSEDELDVGWYEGGRLAAEQVLTEALVLALPPRIVCPDVEACDERTGQLLARRDDDQVGHPGFAALKNFK